MRASWLFQSGFQLQPRIIHRHFLPQHLLRIFHHKTFQLTTFLLWNPNLAGPDKTVIITAQGPALTPETFAVPVSSRRRYRLWFLLRMF